MVAYRFCRPDDSPYIVRAINECYQVHFPDRPPLTLKDFQLEVRELDVWPSNCMVASESSTPIAVCVATKRPSEVLICRVGARPGFERRGHGSHMLTSLSQKLAVLGPPRLAVELPGERPDLAAFFESLGYRRESSATDYLMRSPPTSSGDSSLLAPLGVEDAVELEVLPAGEEICWERQPETLRQRSDSIAGWGIVGGDALAGFALYRDTGEERQVVVFRADPAAGDVVAEMLLGRLGADGLPIRLLQVSEGELDAEWLARLGFEAGARTLRYAATAKAL